MLSQLGTVAAVLEWAETDADEAVTDAELMLGVTDVAAATDMKKVRAAARLAIWRAASAAVAGLHDMSADGQSLSLSQVQTMCERSLAAAEREASLYGLDRAYVVTHHRITRIHDPYSALPPEAMPD